MPSLSNWISSNNSILKDCPKLGIAISKVIETNFEKKPLTKSQNLKTNNDLGDLPKSESIKQEEILISIRLPTPADHGILFPILKSLDQIGMRCHLITTVRNYSEHKDEIARLEHTRISFWENQKISIRELIYLLNVLFFFFKSFTSFLVKKKSKNDTFLFYSFPKLLAFYCFYELKSRVIHKSTSNSVRILLSLGDQIFGFLKENRSIDHIGIQHGLMSHISFDYWSGLVPMNVNEFLVYGQSTKDLIKDAYPNLKSTIVGNPYFDLFKRQKEKAPKKIRVIFFTSFQLIISSGDTIRFKALTKALKEFVEISDFFKENYSFEVKPHPNDNLDYLEQQLGTAISINSSYANAKEALMNADIAITIGSTVDLEAILMKAYSVNLDIPNVTEYSNAVGTVMSTGQFEDFLSNINGHSSLKKEVEIQYECLSSHISFHGESTEIVVSHLLSKLRT